MKSPMKNDLVSIITPLYNKEKYIEETILSVQSQTYLNWEMIVIDDCSTDQGAEIVKRYSKLEARIRYYKNDKNVGAAESRNRAIALAEGRYLAFLDSDDLWKKDKLKKQIQHMKKGDYAFCFSACEVIDESGNQVGKVRNVPESIDYKTLLKGNAIPCLTVVLDKEQFSEVQMPKIGHEDYALWLKLLQNGKNAYGINEVLASYREYGNSLSSNKITAAKWVWNIYRNYLSIGFLKSGYYFVNYFYNAVKKRV